MTDSDYSLRKLVRIHRVKMRCLMLVVMAIGLVLMSCRPGNVIGSAEGWTPVIVDAPNSKLYLASRAGEVLALNTDSGDLIWRYSPPEEEQLGGVFGTPGMDAEKLYVAGSVGDGDKGRLIALNLDRGSGTRVEFNRGEWAVDIQLGPFVGGPTVFGQTVLIGSEDGRLYAFDTGNGEEIGYFETEGLKQGKDKDKRIWSTPIVVDGIAYFGGMDDFFYAVELSETVVDGRRQLDMDLQWKYQTGGVVLGQPLVVDGLVVFGSFDRKVYGFKIGNSSGGTGEERLRWSFDSENWFWASPVSDGKTIYIADMDGKVFALPVDRHSGEPAKWVQDLGGAVAATPVISGGKLVVARMDGLISRLGLSTGSVEKVPIALDKEVRAPLALGRSLDDNMVFLGDRESRIWSINVRAWQNNLLFDAGD
ncbi:hypothetical protein FIM12_00895 [SAR202 cluster bacterium AD-804-J14_MRT_500m]|nr:hypothetical protein [SAR202 cluster bacterium AD-804-J14_MRT_500m]